MDNNDAEQRHRVQPTFKKVKGFQPLQLNWKGYFVDAVFRGGSKHSNYEDTVQKMIIHVVEQIRKHYSEDVPIILRCDSGFFDQKLFRCFQKLGINRPLLLSARAVGVSSISFNKPSEVPAS